MGKPINVFLFKAYDKENFGEYLCKKILEKMGVKCVHYSNMNEIPHTIDHIFTGVGGFLNNEIYSRYLGEKVKKWYVWGSGVHCIPTPDSRLPQHVIDNKCAITLLRGPLTKKYYNIQRDILLGDPGYLASYFFNPPKEEKKNILINHFHDNVRYPIPGIDIHLSGGLLPDSWGSFDYNFFYTLKSIQNANIVMTSSMHVAIVAYSYGVPFAMVPKRETDLSSEWKWYDTLLNMGIKKEIHLCNSLEEGYKWWNDVKKEIIPITREYQEKILKTFPEIL